MTYKIIYADPPWQYRDKANAGERGACHKYPTMPLEDIKALPVGNLADKNGAVLFLWATGPLMQEARAVMDAWGFKFKTVGFVWVKTNKVTAKKILDILRPFEGHVATDKMAKDILKEVVAKFVFRGMGHYTRSNAEYVYIGVKGKNPPKVVDHTVGQVIVAPRLRHSEKPQQVRASIVRMYGDLPRIELFARQSPPGWTVWGNEVESDVTMG